MKKIKLTTTKSQNVRLILTTLQRNLIDEIGNSEFENLQTKTFSTAYDVFEYIYNLMWRITEKKGNEFVSEEDKEACRAYLEWLLQEHIECAIGETTDYEKERCAYHQEGKKLYYTGRIIDHMASSNSEDYSDYIFDIADEKSLN